MSDRKDSAKRTAAGELLDVKVGQPVEVCDRWTGAVLWRGVVESIRAQNGQVSVIRDGASRRLSHRFSRFGVAILNGPIAWRLRVAA